MHPIGVPTALFVLAICLGVRASFPDCANGPLRTNLVCDTTKHYKERATALVNELTLDELAANSVNMAAGVSRLGLPPYNWWSEALHGVAGSPGVAFAPPGSDFAFATSFPQPILMSAAFDDDLIQRVASVISTEARAFNNANRSGLDFFTPNINPFKDPRWGRGQETPGEDPFRISQYVVALITGLQGGLGPDPYYKIVADCKHFAGYDMEKAGNVTRMSFDAIISTQDLAEYYTPSFQACVRDAQAGSIMCSYNSVNGVPSCASPYLLQDILRDFYGFESWDGWVTSDCDAVGNVFNPHNYTTTLANASAVSIKAGTDVDCGTTYSTTLAQAVNESLVSEDTVRTALFRLYGSLVRLGYFDPAESQPYRQITWDDVNTPSAQALALEAASSSIVLLKNDGLLPLSSSEFQSVAVIGPWANATTQMQGNYQGIAPFLISPAHAFTDAGFKVSVASGTSGVKGTSTAGFSAALTAARAADLIVFAGGLDNTVEAEQNEEGQDRTSIEWPGVQLQLLGQLAALGKPVVVLQMGGGQVDSSSLKANDSINALLWGGYPSQSGGTALVDIITGKTAPAGRLPLTQYPAAYANEISILDMTLRPHDASPGRTYKWYTGTPVFPFGFGLHFTNFTLSWAKAPPKSFAIADLVKSAKAAGGFTDAAVMHTFSVKVANTGHVASDYVALLFANTTAGPQPAPRAELVSFSRVKDVAPGKSATASLPVALGQIARVDTQGNSVLVPGQYEIWLDTTGELRASFELTGKETRIVSFPQPR